MIEFVEQKQEGFSIDCIGKVNYIAYNLVERNKTKIWRLSLNGASVNGKVPAAKAETPQEAWEKVKSDQQLIKEFGIEL